MRELSHEKRTLSKRWVIHRLPSADEIKENAIEELTRRHPEEQGTFHNMDEALEFYNLGI